MFDFSKEYFLNRISLLGKQQKEQKLKSILPIECLYLRKGFYLKEKSSQQNENLNVGKSFQDIKKEINTTYAQTVKAYKKLIYLRIILTEEN